MYKDGTRSLRLFHCGCFCLGLCLLKTFVSNCIFTDVRGLPLLTSSGEVKLITISFFDVKMPLVACPPTFHLPPPTVSSQTAHEENNNFLPFPPFQSNLLTYCLLSPFSSNNPMFSALNVHLSLFRFAPAIALFRRSSPRSNQRLLLSDYTKNLKLHLNGK